MEAKIFVIEIPSIIDVVEKLVDALTEDSKPACKKTCNKVDEKPKCKKACNKKKEEEEKPRMKNGHSIGGEPVDENLRFGYGLNVDEPMSKDFKCWKKFLEAHKAYDDFVTAGERCEELGLAHDESIPFTKCEGFRKPIGSEPPYGVELLGESDFPWWEHPCEW